MSWLTDTAKSSIGAKWVMAISGLALFLFLIAHLAGNVLVFSGQDAFNAYAAGLRELPYGLLWVGRIGLVVLFVAHILTGIKLARANRAARPVAYAAKNTVQASRASRSMIYTGMLVLIFLLYHLAHFTWRIVQNTGEKVDALGRVDAYSMVIEGFRQPFIAITYVIAMLILGVHLSHGIASSFQTFGFNHPKYFRFVRNISPVIGWVLALSFISIPVAIWLNLVGA